MPKVSINANIGLARTPKPGPFRKQSILEYRYYAMF